MTEGRLSVEAHARLREAHPAGREGDCDTCALLDEVDRLTEDNAKLLAAFKREHKWRMEAEGREDAAREETEALLRRVLDEKRIRHDHAYPMEVGPHHCVGCDVEAELRAALRPGGEDRG